MANKIVFVTGASRGIGRGIGLSFLQAGYKVAIGYLRGKQEAEAIASRFEGAIAVCVDIQHRDSIAEAVRKTKDGLGGSISILINNAAIAQEKPFMEISDEDWERMLAVNLRGPFAFTQLVLPRMLNKGWGRIVNIASIGGQWGGFNQVHYAAAKAGLINFTQSIAKIYSKDGITCNAVSPGLVQTDMSSHELETEAGREKVKKIPVGRIGTVKDVANAVLYLCSDEASYITGQTINVNGGMYFG